MIQLREPVDSESLNIDWHFLRLFLILILVTVWEETDSITDLD